MNIEERLSDALRPYREQVPASFELLERIEVRTRRRHVPTAWILIGAVAVLAIIVGFATLQLRGDTDPGQLSTANPTREAFVEASDRACGDVTPKLADAVVVFPTPTGVDVVAGQLADVARSLLATQGSNSAPESLRGTVAANRTDLTASIAATDRARVAANNGDVDGADGELRQAAAAIARVANRLVNDGAQTCRTTSEAARR